LANFRGDDVGHSILDDRFAALPGGPFARLRTLLDGIMPGDSEISLALGEPRHAPPQNVLSRLAQADGYDRYPPIQGLPVLRHAIHAWLQRRFGLPNALIDPEIQILPLNGTREGLFMAAQLAPQKPDGLVIMPDPFYQVYAAAALARGDTPYYLPAQAEHHFLPHLEGLSEDILARCSCFYLCSPANPQGTVADRAYLEHLIALAQQYNFILCIDECYADIYDRPLMSAPPLSILSVLKPETIERAPVLSFHSLSKRSNLPGLRSGFVTGGGALMRRFSALRLVAGPQSPIAAQEAAALAWQDDDHASENRTLYHQKIDTAEEIFGTSFGFYRPPGGFFLWLNVGDGIRATHHIWQHSGVRVLPGAYLSANPTHPNAAPYIRVAIVSAPEENRVALQRLYDSLISLEAA